jgi:hypothetical protein
MLRRRSTAGMNPRMAAIIGGFSDRVGLLRLTDCFPIRDCMERYRCVYQFRKRWRILFLRFAKRHKLAAPGDFLQNPHSTGRTSCTRVIFMSFRGLQSPNGRN